MILCGKLTGMSDVVPTQRLPQPLPDGQATWTMESLAARPARLSAVVIDVLVDRIVSGEYSPDGLLPPEPALCRSFEVSRSVVREALKVLQEKGLVIVRQGHGTLVAAFGEWNLLDPVVLAAVVRHDEQREVVDDLVEVRAALEARMAARAASTRTDGDLWRLRELVQELGEALGDDPRYLALDTRFHDELMRISSNRLARAVVHSIHDQARSSAWYHDHTAEDLRFTHRGHLAILEQIEASDQDGAAEAMRQHIISMWHRKRRGSLMRP
jgi:GntR family transcriptional regulator, galactonate operon transcriptional repressor